MSGSGGGGAPIQMPPPTPPPSGLQTEMSRLMWLHRGSKDTHTHTAPPFDITLPVSGSVCGGGGSEHQMRQNEGCRVGGVNHGGENRRLSPGVPAEVGGSVPLVPVPAALLLLLLLPPFLLSRFLIGRRVLTIRGGVSNHILFRRHSQHMWSKHSGFFLMLPQRCGPKLPQ